MTGLVFLDLVRAGFIVYDDPGYGPDNPHVLAGPTLAGLRWASTTFERSNWHPLTWVSLQLDAACWGRWPGGYHLTNVVLHGVNTGLLFWWLQRTAQAAGPAPALLTALLFALHPTRVESVAWVSERKDVLSALFFFLTLIAYSAHAQGGPARPGPVDARVGAGSVSAGPGTGAAAAADSRPRIPPAAAYWVAVGCFALGLLAKPMLVSLPFLLVLLDLWPLDRLGTGKQDPASSARNGAGRRTLGLLRAAARLLPEKAPFFLLAGASCVVTSLAQRGAMPSLRTFPLAWRLVAAVWSVGRYLAKTVWPVDLVIPCEFRDVPPGWAWGLVAGSLLAASAVAVGGILRRPQVFVGWCWFLGMLVPVIGLVQVGQQSMADRYLYLPQIGLFGALSYGLTGATPRALTRFRGLARWTAGAALLWLGALTCRQISYWHDGTTLFAHARQVQGPSYLVSTLLAQSEELAGQPEAACGHYAEALGYYADEGGLEKVATLAMNLRRWDQARPYLEQLTRRHPAEPVYWNSLGVVRALSGDAAGAREAFARCLEERPGFAPARRHLAELGVVEAPR